MGIKKLTIKKGIMNNLDRVDEINEHMCMMRGIIDVLFRLFADNRVKLWKIKRDSMLWMVSDLKDRLSIINKLINKHERSLEKEKTCYRKERR